MTPAAKPKSLVDALWEAIHLAAGESYDEDEQFFRSMLPRAEAADALAAALEAIVKWMPVDSRAQQHDHDAAIAALRCYREGGQ